MSSLCLQQQEYAIASPTTTNRPWKKVGTDLFTLKVKDYLVTVDYFSDYFEVESTTTAAIVKALKHQFSTHGIPDEIILDNGPHLVSEEFANHHLITVVPMIRPNLQ